MPVIYLADIDLQPVIVRCVSEDFEGDGVVVTLEWIRGQENSLYTYHVDVTPQPPFIISLNRSSVQLKLLYNVPYNVSVVKTSPCGQSLRSRVTIDELYYGECPACTQNNNSMVKGCPIQCSYLLNINSVSTKIVTLIR